MRRAAQVAACMALTLQVVACGDDGSGNTSGGSTASGGQGSGSKPLDPACAPLPSCYEQCTCSGNDHDFCVDACIAPPAVGAGGSMAGAGGASTVGAGGASSVGAGGSPLPPGAGGFTDPGAGGAPGLGTGGGTVEPPPPPQYESVRFQTTPFSLPPGAELYRCQNFANPFPGRDVVVVQSQSFMSKGSHHMFVMYNDQNRNGGTEVCSGTEFAQTIISTGNHQTNVVYPPGVGRLVAANQGFRVLVHAYNTTQETIDFKVDVVFHYTDPSAVEQFAGPIFLNQLLFSIPARAQGYKVNGGGTVPEDVYVLTAQSHMHKYGVGFDANASSGEHIYDTTEWSEPPTRIFDPPLLLRAGTRIDYTCTFNNTSNATLRFGDSAQTDEMCILSGTYFAPKTGSLKGKTLGGALSF